MFKVFRELGLDPQIAPLYIADSTIIPEAMGNPPILTIMALAKRIAKTIP